MDRPNMRYQSSDLRVPIRRPLSDRFPHQPPLPPIHFSYDILNRMTDDEEQASAKEGGEETHKEEQEDTYE